MEEKKTVGLEVRTLHNLIKRYIIHTRPPELDEFTVMHNWAMRYFYENRKRDIFQRDFEAYFSIRRSTATKILQLMEKNGLISRESVSYDARLKKITLTDKAVKSYTLISDDIERQEQQITRGISDKELAAFFATIDTIKGNLEVCDD